jgi:Ni,Fe-hydrogenase III large subunit
MHEFRLPVGPQHPSLIEPMHLNLKVDGETVVELDFSLGYNHRGVEKGFEGRPWAKCIYLAERVCGICSFHHQLCFTLGVEKLMGLKIPARASYIRTVIAELERLHNHYLWMGLLAFEMGFDTLFHYLIRDRELVMELFEILCGNRVHYSINAIGGVRRDIDLERAKTVEKKLESLEERSKHYLKVFRTDSSILKRIRGLAVLPPEQARELNVVGPVARASGIRYDIRSLGYLKYQEVKFRPVMEEGCDILARTLVRIRETLQSIRMVQEALIEIPKGGLKARAPAKAPKGESTSRVEALRGELFYYILSGQDHPSRVRMRTPTYANIHCLRQILLGGQIADVPVAVMSLDPCWACCDRMTVVDARTGRRSMVTKEELRHAD